MGRTFRAVTVASGIAFGLVSCGGGSGSSSGSSTPTTPSPTLSGVSISAPSSAAKPGESAQFTAVATFSNGTTQTVTNQAGWQSTNTSVATVSTTGFVTAVTAGEADIRATYQSVTGTAHMTVSAPAPPSPPPPSTFSVCGTVKEDSGSAPVPSAAVSVKDTNFSSSSDSTGHYCVAGLSSGRFTLRASKSGYDIAEVTVNVNGNMAADVPMHKQSAPNPTPAPSPSPSPSPGPNPNPQPGPNGNSCDAAAYPSASCGRPSAVCNDNSLSCSANRSGTCSSHQGVKCWLCPGPLCNGLIGVDQTYSPAFGGYSPALPSGGR